MQLCERFRAAQRENLSPQAYQRLAAAMDLFDCYLDRFAYSVLEGAERQRWQAAYDRDDDRAFANLFGAEHLFRAVDFFLEWYLPKRLQASPEVRENSRQVMQQLLAWVESLGFSRPKPAAKPAEPSGTAQV
ncbi:hypothetical protein LI90_1415 [Carbonactinospora thermoautotrophica]|uniref:Uncharacterized protein n=1 Tax=Carbonactinospora thermoautotrophica TaxID=1469144 RepID=A0A132MPI3_9ACTN|nr:hypothetical protein LI90_1415 [Carbonactinospora thermoautotrophica]